MRIFLSVTFWIILANFGVYFFLGSKGVDFISPSMQDMIAWGGNLGPFTLTGEPWRLLNSMFLHGGLLHLLLNMFLLFQIGFLSEAVWGKVRYLGLYILTGLFGSLASAYWYSFQAMRPLEEPMLLIGAAPPITVSIGASGALLGIAGALMIHAMKEKQNAAIDWKVIAQVVILNVGMGFVEKGVDNACHIGGALSGMVMGSLLLLPIEQKFKMSGRLKSLAAFAFGFLVFASLAFKKPTEQLQTFAQDLRISFKELQRLDAIQAKKQKAELEAVAQAKTIPAPVSMDEAKGKYIIIEGGSADLIGNVSEGFFYIPNRQSNSVTKIDLNNFKVVGELKGPKFVPQKDSGCRDNLCMGVGASGVALSKDKKWAVVSSMVADSVSKIDMQSGEIFWSVKVKQFPRNVYLSANEKYAFAISSVDNSVSVIDLEQKKLLFTKPIGGDASNMPFGQSIGATQLGGRLFIVDPVDGKIVSIDTENPGDLKTEITLRDFLPNVLTTSNAPDKIWISGVGGIRIYDTKNFKLVDQYNTCGGETISEFAVNADGTWIGIEQYDNRILRIVSTKTLRTVRVLPSSSGNNLVRFSGDSKALYMFSMQGPASGLSVFDTAKTLDVAENVAQFGEVLCF